ncbi:MAG: YbhB/YbcL family Raf kinase inhibitor-like protein [Longimicrobiales bacterium]
MAMQISSSAFKNGGKIPRQHTCDGSDVSPQLELGHVPAHARTLALIVDDPDAPRGDWVHWLVYDIPVAVQSFAEGQAPAGATQGRTDFGRTNWNGPCPPPGKPHRYFFKLYALDAALELRAGATKKDLLDAMAEHIIDQAQLMGTYER